MSPTSIQLMADILIISRLKAITLIKTLTHTPTHHRVTLPAGSRYWFYSCHCCPITKIMASQRCHDSLSSDQLRREPTPLSASSKKKIPQKIEFFQFSFLWCGNNEYDYLTFCSTDIQCQTVQHYQNRIYYRLCCSWMKTRTLKINRMQTWFFFNAYWY